MTRLFTMTLQTILSITILLADSNMNRGGVPYSYSNPPGSTPNWKGNEGSYSLEFQHNVEGKVEYFDVYGEVRTNYSQVYWTRNLPINLPPEIVSRFKDKVMVITGYEVDQVTHDGPEPNSTTTATQLGGFSCYPSCDRNGEDKSVPIYNAYNHHYFGWITSSDAKLVEMDNEHHIPNPTTTTFVAKESVNHTYPISIVFKENPGGEFRKSYHGYPSGFGQFIYSPSQWIVEPMQIDTHNRHYHINDYEVGYVPSVLPSILTENNMTDLGNGLSPLIECPCSDRIEKTKVKTPIILTEDSCANTGWIQSKQECVDAVKDAGINAKDIVTIHSSTDMAGCSIQPHTDHVGLFDVHFNTDSTHKQCGAKRTNDTVLGVFGSAELGTLTTLKIDIESGLLSSVNITITISGPSTVWFGVGFNAVTMADEPYTVIIDGHGAVTEHKLGSHSAGTVLKPTVSVISNTVINGIRTVTVQRPLDGIQYLATTGSLNVITAIGSSAEFSYHAQRTGSSVVLLPTEKSACICKSKVQSYISYMGQTKSGFGYNCVDAPRSDMANKGDGTGRYGIENAACDVDTYHGGLQCCKHRNLLIDRGQETQIPTQTEDKYFLKWRYYFQEYVPPPPTSPNPKDVSHRHLHHWVFLIDDAVNDYEEDNIESMYGIEGIGKISANLTVRDLGLEDTDGHFSDNGNVPKVPFYSNTTIMPLVMTPHCHAPSCIREEIWNADTGEIICNVTALYGDKAYGGLQFNEPNYITIPPCIFGFQKGLQHPFVLSLDTNITAIKYFNNTWRHLGQMAQWTGLMVYDTDPY